MYFNVRANVLPHTLVGGVWPKHGRQIHIRVKFINIKFISQLFSCRWLRSWWGNKKPLFWGRTKGDPVLCVNPKSTFPPEAAVWRQPAGEKWGSRLARLGRARKPWQWIGGLIMPREGKIEEIRLGLSLGSLYLSLCCFRQFRVLLNVEKGVRRNHIFSHYRFRS